MFGKYRRNSAAARFLEEQLYEQVVNELSSGHKRNGVCAKAFANSGGKMKKQKPCILNTEFSPLKMNMNFIR